MNFYAVLFVIISVYAADSLTYGAITCGLGDIYLTNPADCSSYYQCTNGEPILLYCAPDHSGSLVFDPSLNVCVWPTEYDCTPPVETTTDLVETSTELVETTTTEHAKTITEPTETTEPCQGQTYIVNPDDCGSFYECTDGVPQLIHCPPTQGGTLVFDPNLNVCVWPSEYDCTVTTTELPVNATEPVEPTTVFAETTTEAVQTTTEPTETADPCEGQTYLVNPNDCGSFYQCTNGVPKLLHCPPTLVFDPSLNVCVWTSEYECTETTIEPVETTTEAVQTTTEPKETADPCKGQTFLVNPDDCGSFYQCNNGVPHLLYCPQTHDGTLVFDPNLNVCVWPSEYDCTVTTTELPPSATEPPVSTAEPVETTTVFSETTTEAVQTTTQSTEKDNPCEGQTYLVNPDDCGSFYQCTNGVPKLLHCPPTLVFDPSLNVCVWTSEYECTETTTEPVETTREPVEKTTEPVEKTTEPVETTTEPIETTTEPVETTKEPVETTTEPVETTTEPIETTTEPIETTTEPIETTTEPIETTTELVETTTEPIDTTTEPIETTTEPVETTTEPVETTTELVETTTEPIDTTTEPVETTTEPVETTTEPVETTTEPVETTTEPILTTTEPIETTTEPVESTTEPIETTTEPIETTTEPIETTTELVETTTELIDTTTEPIETTTEPVETTTEPVETTTEPIETTTEPIDTTTEPIETTTEPVETTTEPVETTTEPVETTTEPIETTTEPVETTTEPIETTTEPIDTTTEPAETTTEPAETTTEPIETTTEPIETTTEPIETTTEPIETTPEPTEIFNPCHEFNNPTTCLKSPNNCSFCFDTCFRNGDVDLIRCDKYDNLRKAGCKAFTHNQTEYNSVVNTSPNCTTWVVCEPGKKRNISVTFSLEKHPLDLYYLMDFSASMGDDQTNLITLSSGLLETLANLTDDFHIGFGTFVDKPVYPFGSFGDYSFHNDFPLTSATDGFVKKISELLINDGGDGPESHGDALAQVIECEKQVGWRNNTRRVVLLATDIYFHVAGDGYRANINDPYVEGCYLDSDGSYTKELTMDYPSIEQLANAFSKKQATTTVIFATSSYNVKFYQEVASQFKSAYVGVLKIDSSNVLELIKTEFAKIDSKMEVERSDTSDSVSFKYYSNCMNTGDERETAICESLPKTGEVTFVVEIDLAECPKDKSETGMVFQLNPVGLPIFIEVELSFLCE